MYLGHATARETRNELSIVCASVRASERQTGRVRKTKTDKREPRVGEYTFVPEYPSSHLKFHNNTAASTAAAGAFEGPRVIQTESGLAMLSRAHRFHPPLEDRVRSLDRAVFSKGWTRAPA